MDNSVMVFFSIIFVFLAALIPVSIFYRPKRKRGIWVNNRDFMQMYSIPMQPVSTAQVIPNEPLPPLSRYGFERCPVTGTLSIIDLEKGKPFDPTEPLAMAKLLLSTCSARKSAKSNFLTMKLIEEEIKRRERIKHENKDIVTGS